MGTPGAALFNQSVTATVPTGTTDSYDPTGYVGGTTNRLILTPTDSTSTLAGLLSSGVADGFAVQIYNPSSTLSLTFLHQSSLATNDQFNCVNGEPVVLEPFDTTIACYIAGSGWTLI